MGREKSSILLNYGYQHSDGFMAHSESRKQFVNFAGDVDVSDRQSINFYAGFANIKPTMDALNAWNRDKRFGNAYLDADLDAAIEYDVNLEYGVTRENLDAAFGVWSVLLEQYTEYVGYKPGP